MPTYLVECAWNVSERKPNRDDNMTQEPKLLNARHGDLLIREISSIPHGAKAISTNIIAEGEKTGHNHVLNGSHQIYETIEPTQKQINFEAKQQLKIEHPEHNTIIIPKGIYTVVHERHLNVFLDRVEEVVD